MLSWPLPWGRRREGGKVYFPLSSFLASTSSCPPPPPLLAKDRQDPLFSSWSLLLLPCKKKGLRAVCERQSARGGEGKGPTTAAALGSAKPCRKKKGGEEVLLLPMLLRLQAVPFEGEGEEDLEDGERTKSWGERSWRSVLTRGFFLATCVIGIGVREVGFLPFLSLGSLSLFPLLPSPLHPIPTNGFLS